jgi:hypothetical protein
MALHAAVLLAAYHKRGRIAIMPKRKLVAGPRGGKYTVTKTGLVRKTFNLHRDEWAALRRKAFEEERSASEIVREMLRKYLGIAE